jgi:hypothetical protein
MEPQTPHRIDSLIARQQYRPPLLPTAQPFMSPASLAARRCRYLNSRRTSKSPRGHSRSVSPPWDQELGCRFLGGRDRNLGKQAPHVPLGVANHARHGSTKAQELTCRTRVMRLARKYQPSPVLPSPASLQRYGRAPVPRRRQTALYEGPPVELLLLARWSKA